LNDPKAVAPTMRPERFVQDTEEMAAWLRKDLGKRKIFVLGHSWGSYLGLELARRHPERLFAYIGVGQVTNSPESERRGWAFARAKAQAAHNDQAVAELDAIAPYAAPGKPIPLKDLYVQRRWANAYGGVMAYRASQDEESHAARLSPDYTDAEVSHIWDGNDFSEGFLLSDMLGLDLSRIATLKCPLILMEGRHDKTVNADVAHDWFERVRAPEKHFVWFENSGHEVMTEEPGKFLLSLVRYARP
jgi:proline iminopeptidase